MQVKFQDPTALSKELHDIGFKGIWMLDPGIAVEKGYEAYDTGSELNIWIQTADGKPFVGTLPFYLSNHLSMHQFDCRSLNSFLCTGECWPGATVYPDFTMEKTRRWWTELVKKFVTVGVDGIWNDMNEPAVFKVRYKNSTTL